MQVRDENREYRIKYNRDYKKRNRDDLKNKHLIKHFNITLDDYKKMLEEQNECCKICNKTLDDLYSFFVDHDHKTGRIRGLLCQQCNIGLGVYYDNTDLLKKAISYLEENRQLLESLERK